MTTPAPAVDPFGPARAHAAPPPMGDFATATVLDAADVHVARTLVRLAGERSHDDDLVALGVAFAVRAVRLGSVTVDLDTIAATATVDEGAEVDVDALPWPDPDAWRAALAASPLVAVGDEASDRGDDGGACPLRLLGSRLALDRYWRHERAIAADLVARAGRPTADVDEALLEAGLDRLPTQPRRAAAGRGDLGAATVLGDRGRARHGQDDHGRRRARPPPRAGDRVGRDDSCRARRTDGKGGGPFDRGGARSDPPARRPRRRPCHRPRRRSIDDPPPAGRRAATAASATTGAISCRTRSS